jgi:HK97 family phage portal protein
VPFAITDGQLSAIGQEVRPNTFATVRGISLDRFRSFSYAHIYRTQPAVRTVVDFLARGVASMACQTFERVADNDRKRLSMDESPLAKLLEFRANPSHTGYRLIHALISDRAVYDEAHWLKIRPDGPGSKSSPGWLRRIPVPNIAPSAGDWFEVTQWRITRDRAFIDVPANDVVTFLGYDPTDTRKGVSPIESLRTILAEEYAAMEARAALWDRGALAAGVITRPADAPEWADPARKRFESDWAAYMLAGPKSGSSPVLEDGMEWKTAGYSPRDAQYVESRKLTREEVAAAYHIPPSLVGLLDNATFSNVADEHKQVYVDTLGPWTVSTEAEIGTQLVGEFHDETKVYVEFNVNAKLKGDFETTAAVVQATVGAPIMTPNEGRGRLNLPAIEGGDELVKPLNVTTGGQASPQDSAPQPGDVNPLNPNEPAPPKAAAGRRLIIRKGAPESDVTAHIELLRGTFERQRRSVLGKLAAAKGVVEVHDLFDVARWSTELGADLLNLALPLSASIGYTIAKNLDKPDGYDPGDTVNYLTAQTNGTATSINIVTRNDIGGALGAHDVEAALAAVFAGAIATRSISAGRAQSTSVAGWTSVEAGRQVLGAASARKRWATGVHPREAHQAINGETRLLDEHFSNGARWPGDAMNLTADDIAGCNCDIEIIPEGVAA